MNLALMSSQKNWGGGEQFLWTLGTELVSRGHNVLWIAPPKSKLFAKLEESDSLRFAMSGRHPSPLAMLRLRNAIAQYGIEVLHMNDSHAVTWGTVSTLTKTKIHRVAVKHTNFPVRSSAKYNWFVDRIACVSNSVFETCLEGGILERKLRLINGSVPTLSLERHLQRTKLAEYLGVSPSKKLIVCVGSLIECKGYLQLIHSLQQLRQEHPDIVVALFGEGPERSRIEDQVQQSDLHQHVLLKGFQDFPEQWIVGADLFVHPASSEGLPLVAMHAQMAGTPIVASDVGGLRELLREPGTGAPLGWIVDPKDNQSLTQTLSEALRDANTSRIRAERGKQVARVRYSLQRMIVEYESLYRSLISKDSSIASRLAF